MKIINLQRRHYRVYSSSSMGSNLENQIIYCTRRLYLGSSSPSVSSNLEKQILYKDDITLVVPPLLWAPARGHTARWCTS